VTAGKAAAGGDRVARGDCDRGSAGDHVGGELVGPVVRSSIDAKVLDTVNASAPGSAIVAAPPAGIAAVLWKRKPHVTCAALPNELLGENSTPSGLAARATEDSTHRMTAAGSASRRPSPADQVPPGHHIPARWWCLPAGSPSRMLTLALAAQVAPARGRWPVTTRLYRAVLRAEVRERLPWVSWSRTSRGLFEIDGVPARVLRHFSRRRVEIEQRAAELVGAGRALSRDAM
jgi:hypothetical protein